MVGDESPDVDVSRPSLGDACDDATEAVVEEHDVGCLPGDVRAARAHGDPDVRLVKGWAVVHAVPRHGEHVTARAERAGYP